MKTPWFTTFIESCDLLENCLREFNQVRLHSSLGRVPRNQFASQYHNKQHSREGHSIYAERVILLHIIRKLMQVGIYVAMCLSVSTASGQGTLLYSNARTGPPTPLGLVLGHNQFAGMRFELPSGAIIDGVGGNLAIDSNIGDNRIFAALVRLTDINDFPDSRDLSTPDVLATTAFSATPDITDVMAPINPLTVGPGTYALVLGSGLFGTSGEGAMSLNNPNFLHSSTVWHISSGWHVYGAEGGLRFTVYGTPIPEPGSASLMLLAALTFYHTRRSRK